MIIAITIFLISAATLGLELVLLRTLSIGHWHNFSYLVISTALLGFGAGGTFICVWAGALTKHYKKAFWALAFGFAVAVPVVFYLSQKIPLDELQLIWDRRQVCYLLGYYLLFFIPFFCAGAFLALAFSVFGEKAHRLYFYNMTGSAIGAAGAVALMYGHPPQQLLLVFSSIGFLAAVLITLEISRKLFLFTLFTGVAVILVFSPPERTLDIRLSENKSLVYYRALPDARIVDVRYSPLARLDCLTAPSIRYFPGLSFTYAGKLPEQMLLISDADGISAVNHFDDVRDLKCYDYTTSALSFHLIDEPKVCIIGAGGGSDICQALAAGAPHITAVEMNSQIPDLLRNRFNEFSSGLYRRDDVKVVIAEGRSFLETTEQLFDIINISLLDSFSASAAGLYALNESHLYTIEAVEQSLEKLNPQGLLTITRVLKIPPRDGLKMFATIVEALRRRGLNKPGNHIIMIRSWAAATIVVSRQPFSDNQLAAARRFARERSFDLVHLPDIEPNEVNYFHQLENPIYYQAARKMLSDEYENFSRDYAYNIRPATDDKPYFFDFFKWKSLPRMIRAMGRRWLLFSEWGYLVLAATLLQAVLASAIFILLPLFVAKHIKAVGSGKASASLYFLLLGLAYMFLEMGFIQKMTLLIGHPVFGVAVTLLGFLFFSGCGSLVSARFFKSGFRRIWTAVFAVIVFGVVLIAFINFAFDWLVGFSRAERIILGLLIIAPLAFFMGIPFPTGLKQIHLNRKPLVPLAWAVNGFASVTAAVLGTFLAISVGFNILAMTALLCYLLAAMLAKKICS